MAQALVCEILQSHAEYNRIRNRKSHRLVSLVHHAISARLFVDESEMHTAALLILVKANTECGHRYGVPVPCKYRDLLSSTNINCIGQSRVAGWGGLVFVRGIRCECGKSDLRCFNEGGRGSRQDVPETQQAHSGEPPQVSIRLQ